MSCVSNQVRSSLGKELQNISVISLCFYSGRFGKQEVSYEKYCVYVKSHPKCPDVWMCPLITLIGNKKKGGSCGAQKPYWFLCLH